MVCVVDLVAVVGVLIQLVVVVVGEASVATQYGIVVGVTNVTYQVNTYRTIPFASPPVDLLRWKPPVRWNQNYVGGVLDTTNAIQRPCPQLPNIFGTTISPSYEDCLYLNVFAPVGASNLPVMFWIHGGSFTNGCGSDSLYDATIIASTQNVVVVTTNYRLGIFGFLSLPQLLAESNTTGNFGFLDQREALYWVKSNIEAFGGNPDEMTIFGESAGAISVLYHLTAPGSASLFQRAIMESTSTEMYYTLDTSYSNGQTIANTAGCASNTLSCMRAIDVASLVALSASNTWNPVVDGTQIVGSPRQVLQSGGYSNVPVLLGTNRDEGTLFIYGQVTSTLTAAAYTLIVQQYYFPGNTDLSTRALELYPPLTDQDNRIQLSELQGDSFFKCPTRTIARTFYSTQTNTFAYWFTQVPPCSVALPEYGVWHACDLIYVFDNPAKFMCTFADSDRQLSQRIQSSWGTFAKTSQPDTLSIWPPFSSSDVYAILNSTGGTCENLAEERCDFWDEVQSSVQSSYSTTSMTSQHTSTSGGSTLTTLTAATVTVVLLLCFITI
ncbi:carboxylesterase family protein [Pelomyxa schiedti]|nr:carboxylesterase family protein [Pelomyxa schiedti]